MQGRRLIFAAALATLAPGAAATEADETRYFDARARRAYDAGNYATALESFLIVHEVTPSYGSLFNVALCADLAGKGDMAFALYREYLASDDPDGERRKEAERRAAHLDGKLALLEVSSEPPGAKIFVDRAELGQYGVTPRTIAVPVSARRILLELPGHRTRDLPVAVKPGERTSVRAALDPILGETRVEVEPRSARLEFRRDGVPVPASPESGTYRLPVGQYTVVASAPGYVTSEARARVSEGDVGQVTLWLAALPRERGRLLVSAGAAAADVYVDGKKVAVTPATLTSLDVGEHLIEVRAGTAVERRKVTIVAGKATYVQVELAAGKGRR